MMWCLLFVVVVCGCSCSLVKVVARRRCCLLVIGCCFVVFRLFGCCCHCVWFVVALCSILFAVVGCCCALRVLRCSSFVVCGVLLVVVARCSL